MAIYVVYSGGDGSSGSASSLTPTSGEWSTAYQSLHSASLVATSADTILIAHDHSHLAAISSSRVTAFPTSPGLVIMTINRTTSIPVTTPSAFEAINSGNYSWSFSGCAYIHGIILGSSTNNSSVCSLYVGSGTSPNVLILDTCELYIRNANTSAEIALGTSIGTNNDNGYIELINSRYRTSTSNQKIVLRSARIVLRKFSISPDTAVIPTTIFSIETAFIGTVTIEYSDLSMFNWTNLLTAASLASGYTINMIGCRLPSGWNPGIFNATAPGGVELYWYDCDTGDSQLSSGYASAAGSVVTDYSIYLAGSPANISWRVVTTANCSRSFPLKTPMMERYAPASVGTITPYVEILRNNDSTTAYQDLDMYLEIYAKTNSGNSLHSMNTNAPANMLVTSGTNHAAGIGTGSWTGSSGSRWSGKLQLPSSITLQEDGTVKGTIYITKPSISLSLCISPFILW